MFCGRLVKHVRYPVAQGFVYFGLVGSAFVIPDRGAARCMSEPSGPSSEVLAAHSATKLVSKLVRHHYLEFGKGPLKMQ